MKLILTILLAAFMIWSSKGKKSSIKKADVQEPGGQIKINGMEHWLKEFFDNPDNGSVVSESCDDDCSAGRDVVRPEIVMEADAPSAETPVVCKMPEVDVNASEASQRNHRFNLSSRSEAQKAFIYSEIFRRKY